MFSALRPGKQMRFRITLAVFLVILRFLPAAGQDTAFRAAFEKGLQMLEKGDHARALDQFSRQLQALDSNASPKPEYNEKIAKLYNVIGAIYEETGLWNDAMAMYMNSLKACDETGNEAGKAKVYNNIGKLYYIRDDMPQAETLFNKAVTINTRLNLRSELFNNYNNLAGIYSHHHNPGKALEYALIALGQLNLDKDFYDQVALSYYHQAAGIQASKSYQIALAQSLLSISSVYMTMRRTDSAEYYINRALRLSEELNNPSVKLEVYRAGASFYETTRNFQKAYRLSSKVMVLTDSLESLNSLTRIEQIQAVYEVVNKEKDNKILQQKVNLQQLAIARQRTILVGAVVIVLFFIYLVIMQVRSRKRERENNRMIMDQADMLHRQEKNIMLNKEKSLELELDYKNRQLTSYALHLARNNEFLFRTTEELKQILLGMNPRDKEKSDRIREMITELNQATSGNVWDEFRLYFEEVHQSFEKNLTAAFPNLSPNDKKICALLKLGLSTKEIASITFRELRSVEAARNRLRKKLNLAPDVNIHTYLSQF
jgi:tetratricopeptide (TPR) repeat protein